MWVTGLDQILSYYTMVMSSSTQKYLTIILPWGKYQYLKILMGLNIWTDIFQRKITKLFDGLDYVMVCIDDVLVVTKGSFSNHLTKLHRVLEQMRSKEIQIDPRNSFFFWKEVEYLGYVI